MVAKSEAMNGQLNPLALAFLGDAVFELLIRRAAVESGAASAGRLSKLARGGVNAKAQARMYFKIAGSLTEEELSVMRRGRNSSPRSRAKNATVSEYRHATGLEALFGHLYLRGESERINELFYQCIEGEKL